MPQRRSAHNVRLCPVCWLPVMRTVHHRIGGHFDSAAREANMCPGSYEPFYIAIDARTVKTATAEGNPL